MNYKITATILFTFLCLKSFSQSLSLALDHNKDKEFLSSDAIVKQINKNTTEYGENKTESYKSISTYNTKNKIIESISFDDNHVMDLKFTCKYDSTETKKIKKTHESWDKPKGHLINTIDFEYDTRGFLIKVTERANNSLNVTESHIKNNEKGHPIEYVFKIGKSEYHHRLSETAEYDYPNNLMKIQKYDKKGNPASMYQRKIDNSVKDIERYKYDQNGNIIKFGHIEIEYQYDQHLNWISKTAYKTVNGERKKQIVITRDITYLN